MFDTLYSTYKNIISCLGIVGYLEKDIIKRGINTKKNLQLNCLYALPNKETTGLNDFIYEMMFPDNNHKIPCPKFFTITLTNREGTHSYLYCLKFSESYQLLCQNEENKEIDVPLVIFIKSEKQDLESFKQLLNIINSIIVNDEIEKEGNINYKNINNYKKVQLINFFYFLFSLPKAPPHSLVKLKIDKEIINNSIESIDFYFSSNCEIPCNKNDTDINILFLLLEQSIIIKVLFAILTEKQIVFRASQAYLLHIIIPSILKLIFPFKWTQTCITVLPKEKINLLEAVGSLIFGILSDVISLNDLLREYPGKIVVDCDTNEIFGDSYYEEYIPPKVNLNEFVGKDEKNKNKENSKININTSNKLTQGNNLINIGGSYLYKYENDTNNRRVKLNFEEKNNIIIDVKRSQFLIDKTNAFVDSNEWKWLRKNIQLVRNPEIFDLENINIKKNNLNQIYLSDEEDENIILPNRPFSYNIQNIFMTYILNKLNYSESEFMSIFKHTGLFQIYNDKKKFQNDSGPVIVENIFDLKNKNQQRNIDNSFIIEYVLQSFKTQIFIEKIDAKLGDKTKINEADEKVYNILKTIINDYNKVKNEEDSNNNFDYMYNKDSINGRKSEMKKQYGRLTRSFIHTHERNKTSLLRETNSNNYNFILSGIDKSLKETFKFYKEEGFINFINLFEKFLNEEKIDIKEELYEQKINEQVLDIILNNEDIFNQNINFSETNNFVNSFEKDKKDSKKNPLMGVIQEKENEEEDEKENNELYYGRSTVIQKGSGDEYIISTTKTSEGGINYSLNSVFNDMCSDIELNKFLYSENIINFFPNYPEQNENTLNEIENKNGINHKCQYYLFIASILENIVEKNKSDEFIEKIKNKKKINRIDMKSLILKIYRTAYKFSGEKHRDFPYFSYYNFLINIELDKLKLLSEEFSNISNAEQNLYEIYAKIIHEQELINSKKLQKKLRKEKLKQEKLKQEKEVQESNEIKEKQLGNNDKKNGNKNKIKNSKLQDIFKIFENKLVNERKTSDYKPNFLNSISEFNLFLSYPINRETEFETENLNLDCNSVIKNIAKELLSLLPKKEENINKSNQDIIIGINGKILENKKIFKLIGQLKYICPDKLISCRERLCFWVNSFNFLIIFTIFYKKWNINSQDDWKYFFQKVKYLIGNKYFTFNDIQSLLYKKPLFFQSAYKKSDYEDIKKMRVDKSDDAKTCEKQIPFLYNPFIIFLPIKDFLKPIILETNKLEEQFTERIKSYLLNYIIIDKDKSITIPELLNNYQQRFICKEFKKFQSYMNESIFNLLKEKKYKGNNVNNYEWKLDFDSLLNN